MRACGLEKHAPLVPNGCPLGIAKPRVTGNEGQLNKNITW